MRRLAGLLAVALLAACSSDGGSSAVADAKAFRCPSAAEVTKALGKSVATVKQSSGGSRTVICAYSAPSFSANAFVSVSFGAGSVDYAAALKILGATKQTPVSGLADQATVVVDRDVRQLIVRGGSRLLTVTTDPDDTVHETAVARVFLR